jgi:hypothetical protein
MADVFVSYAKTDRALASKLVAMLEAEGWSVWWDTGLGAADLYRDEIMKQLVSARAVIAIWTPNSIKSDWVRAEAGTAKKDGKLIPVKTADVAYADIPLPFGEMHTENLEASEFIRAAVVAQLAKPAVEPTAWALLGKGLKWELLSWWGIIGGAITLFTAISATLKLADWARWLVEHWQQWTHAFWVWAFGWLGIHLPPEWTALLSFLLFWSSLTIGQVLKSKGIVWERISANEFRRTIFRQPTVILFITYLLIFGLNQGNLGVLGGVAAEMTAAVLFVLLLFARYRLHTFVSFVLMLIFFSIMTLYQLLAAVAADGIVFLVALAFGVGLPTLLLLIAPTKAITRRLIFLALGLILLIALNELSKLGLDLTAPRLQG